MQKSKPTRIVIVGGGAGGLELATRLGRRFGRDPLYEVTLVDRAYTHLWKPLLHEVAAGSLNSYEDEMSYIAHAHWNHFHFKLGALKGLDRKRREIVIAASLDAEGHAYIPERTLAYDFLVIAIGSVTNDFGIEGVADHCLFLDSREQADTFHQKLLRACFAANAQTEAVRPGQLHIAIAGAGATGVELAAELHDALHEMVEFGLDRIDAERDIRIHLIEGSERILPGLPARVSTATLGVLEQIGVTVHTDKRIARATAEAFETEDGSPIEADIKVWAAGIRAPEVLAELDGLESNRINQLLVRPGLQTTLDDRIFALGDCAACPMPDSDRNVPPRAQAAHQQATHTAQAIERLIAGRPVGEYRYRDFGSLISLSAHSAVGTLMGNLFRSRSTSVPLEGRFARWAYISLYKMHQIAVKGVLRTAATTMADFFTRASKPRLKLH